MAPALLYSLCSSPVFTALLWLKSQISPDDCWVRQACTQLTILMTHSSSHACSPEAAERGHAAYQALSVVISVKGRGFLTISQYCEAPRVSKQNREYVPLRSVATEEVKSSICSV